MNRVVLGFALISVLAVTSAAAQTPNANRGGLSLPIDPQLLNDLPEIKGVVSWKVLGQVNETQVDKKYVPEFSPEVAKLDQQEVKLQGYMMPIVAGEKHERFLLTMRPPHCPFCLSVGPQYVVEVKAKAPIKHTLEPVVVAGRFHVLRDDPYGLYYRLTAAQLSAPK